MVTYASYLFAILALLELFLLENIASSAEQGFSTYVQVCNDITSCYPEGSRNLQHPRLSLLSTLGGSNPDGTSTHTHTHTQGPPHPALSWK